MKIPAILLLLSGISLAQGPLQPSTTIDPKTGPVAPLNGSGVPQPTMRTLYQVEPRTPLVVGSPGVTVSAGGNISISQSGSYYLTSDLTIASGDAITINTGPATIDLNGFNISTTSNPASGVGISAVNSYPVNVINGNILNFGTASSSAYALSGPGFQYGIFCSQPYQSTVSRVNISGASLYAIYADGNASSLVESCTVRECVNGIRAATITNCVVTAISKDAINGKVITGCSAISLLNNAIMGTVVTGCDGKTLASLVASGPSGIYAPDGIVTNSRGDNNNPGVLANTRSIYALTASGCVAIGQSQITNRYNMPASP